MEKKIPSVFANRVDKNIGNNSEVFYSNNKLTDINDERSGVVRNVNQKINEIFSSSNYIYKADVEIVLKSGTVKKRIIGKNSFHLITMDNELIPISDVLDIKRIN